jgi:hypothetical protein
MYKSSLYLTEKTLRLRYKDRLANAVWGLFIVLMV